MGGGSVGPGGAGAPKAGPSVQKGCYVELSLSCSPDDSSCLTYNIYGSCRVTAQARAPYGKTLDSTMCNTCVQCIARSLNNQINIESIRSSFSLNVGDSMDFNVFKRRNNAGVISDSDCRSGGVGSASEWTAPITVSCLACDAADASTSFSSSCCSQELWTSEVTTSDLCPDGKSKKKKTCHKLCSRTKTNCDDYTE